MRIAEVSARPMHWVYTRYGSYQTRCNYHQDSELPRGRWLCCKLYSIASGCATKVAHDYPFFEDNRRLINGFSEALVDAHVCIVVTVRSEPVRLVSCGRASRAMFIQDNNSQLRHSLAPQIFMLSTYMYNRLFQATLKAWE